MTRLCCIFAGGPETGLPCLPIPENAFVLCADSGLRLAERMGVKPDWVLGDFDSLGAWPEGYSYQAAPVEKDDTDTMLCVRHALAAGYSEIRIYGAFGGRLDHTFANLQVLRYLHAQGVQGMLIGANDYALIQGAGSCRIPKMDGFSLSVFALTDRAEGVSESGVYYPLNGGVMTADYPLGISNVITAESAKISCETGLLLLICSRL